LNGAVSAGFEYKISVRYFIPQSNGGSYSEVSIRDGASIKIATDSSPATGSWVTLEGTATYTSPQIRIQFTGTSVAGDKVYIRELSISRTKQDATVVTWYDQSANANHATQTVAGDQPKIAEAGALLADIDFAGDTFLQTTSLQEPIPVSFFCVNRFDSTLTGFRPFLGNGILDSSSQGYGLLYNDPSNAFVTQVRIPSASDNSNNTATTAGDVNGLTTALITASTITSFYNGGNETSGTNNQGAITPNRTLTIGGSETGGTPTVTRFFNGGVSEIILYSTDQSSNRFKIESNINNYYSIYTAAVNGFVDTWYDQSGNSRDATQATQNNQPKIVNAGSYLGGLDFDGVDDFLQATSAISSNGQADTTVFVAKLVDNAATYGFCDNYAIADPHFIRATSTNFGAYFNLATDLDYATVNTNENLHFVQKATVSNQSSGSLNGVTDSLNAGTYGYTGGVKIGVSRVLTNYLKGSMKELIIYDSDQSANRTGIESNIAEEYGITLP
jgi:hypothetical protein